MCHQQKNKRKMVLRLDKIIFALLIFMSSFLVAQEDPANRTSEKDYKDGDQFEKFRRRRKIVGAWQMDQLKNGALVVKLKKNQLVIDALQKKGDSTLAEKTRLEAAGINLNVMRAFRSRYTFSKLYFIYSTSGDSLLNGVRENIFLDSNLLVDPTIRMTEAFYLTAQVDRVYNSSIGFVPEDSARSVRENGTSNNIDSYIIIKNKYGHQLKNPFPFANPIRVTLEKTQPLVYIRINNVEVPFNVGLFNKPSNSVSYVYKNEKIILSLPKYLTYDKLENTVGNINESFYRFFQTNPPPVRLDPSIRPFMY